MLEPFGSRVSATHGRWWVWAQGDRRPVGSQPRDAGEHLRPHIAQQPSIGGRPDQPPLAM